MNEFRFPILHITRQFNEGDRTVEEVVTSPVCDFCMDVRVTWDYDADDFAIEAIEFASQGGWAVCDECARLIEARLLPELTARIVRSWRALGSLDEDALDKAGQIVQGFFDHRHPGRMAFG